MKSVRHPSGRWVSGLTGVIGVMILFMATMTGHDKYREKLIRQPMRPFAGTLQLTASFPKKVNDASLLLEIRIDAEKSGVQATLLWNGSEMGRIPAFGHHFVTIPRTSFLPAGNTLSLRGLPPNSQVSMLEIKNLYGFSTGLLPGVMVLPGSASLHRLPAWLALVLATLLLFLALAAPRSMSLAANHRSGRFGAWAITIFFIAILALPLFFSARVYLGLNAVAMLFAAMFGPGLWRVLKLLAGLFKSHALPWIRLKLLSLDFSPREWKILGALALAAIFIFYAANRQRYVGAADWYGYYAESQLFRQGQLTMKTAYPPAQYPAFAPLGFDVVGNKIIPQYPPGFPLLLALFGLVGLEFFVCPLAGVLTVWILYLILKKFLNPGIALIFSALWAFFPITLFGSTNLMSDLIATLFILFTYYFFMRNKIFWSGVAFSYAVVVRPTTVLFFIIFLPFLFKKKKFWPFCFSAAIIGSLYGLYNWAVFGKPWMTGYGNFFYDLISDVFFHHFFYYGNTLFIILTPLLLIPALWALVRRKTHSWFYFSWFASFLIFYSCWRSGADAWWYLRFLLPGLPALFILSAIGMEDLHARMRTWKPDWKWANRVSAVLILLVMLSHFILYSNRQLVFVARTGEIFYKASKKVQALVPPNALVGGLEMSGPLRLYAGLESYRWDQVLQSMTLMSDFLEKGRPVFLVIEPWHEDHPKMDQIKKHYILKEIASLPESMGMRLVQVFLLPGE